MSRYSKRRCVYCSHYDSTNQPECQQDKTSLEPQQIHLFELLEIGHLAEDLLTFGLVSGIGMAAANSAALGISAHAWLADAKIVLIMVVWVLLGTILALRYKITLKGKKVAYATLVVFFLIVFAIVGTTVFCGTKHDFVKDFGRTVESIK